MIIPLEDEAGDILAKARSGRGLSVMQAAGAAGLAPGALRALEGLEREASDAELAALAPVLGLEPERLGAIARHRYHPVLPPAPHTRVQVRRLELAQPDGWRSYCYLVGWHGAEEALVIDPGAEGERVLAELDALGWRPRYVALTHTHRDHVGGLPALMQEWAVSVLVSELEVAALGLRPDQVHAVHHGERLPLARGSFEVIATPGHTPGSVCFRLDDCVFVGDTLFAGSMGRTNVPGAFEGQRAAVRERLLTLPDEFVLYPGHGPATTVGQERRHNPFF